MLTTTEKRRDVYGAWGRRAFAVGLVVAFALVAWLPAQADAARGGTATVNWGAAAVQDTFTAGLNTSAWNVYDSPNAAQFPRARDAVSVSGGELRLTGGVDASGKDVSGGLSSSLNQMYGRWDVRFRVDRGAGYSAVVLLWPQTEKWPADGEIDAVEVTDPTRLTATSNVHNGVMNNLVQNRVNADFTQWHTVSVVWLPTGITFSLDGRVTATVPTARGVPGVNPVPTTSPMHLAIQLDKGCVQGIPCRNASTPAKVVMHVSDVAIYRYQK